VEVLIKEVKEELRSFAFFTKQSFVSFTNIAFNYPVVG